MKRLNESLHRAASSAVVAATTAWDTVDVLLVALRAGEPVAGLPELEREVLRSRAALAELRAMLRRLSG